MDIVGYVKGEWAVLKGAPVSFVILLVLGLAGGFTGGTMWRGQELANARSLIELKNGQIDDYRRSIEQRLDKVEEQLSQEQVSLLQTTLSGNPGEVTIVAPNDARASQQVIDAFTTSGWTVLPSETRPHTDFGAIELDANNDQSAQTIAEALSSAGVKYEQVRQPEDGGSFFFLGIGSDQ